MQKPTGERRLAGPSSTRPAKHSRNTGKRYKQRVCDQYATLCIQPLGEFTATQNKLLAETTEFVGRFYGMPVKTLDVVRLEKIPEKARRVPANGAAPQILTHYLLDDVLKPRRPKDAAAVLGLTASDLWPGDGWNFVFGQASLTERVGDPGRSNGLAIPKKTRLRTNCVCLHAFKVAVHETGHMLGIQHCTAWQCCMNGSNHLAESDDQPLEFCPECQSKLWWTCARFPCHGIANCSKFAESHAAWRTRPRIGGRPFDMLNPPKAKAK